MRILTISSEKQIDTRKYQNYFKNRTTIRTKTQKKAKKDNAGHHHDDFLFHEQDGLFVLVALSTLSIRPAYTCRSCRQSSRSRHPNRPRRPRRRRPPSSSRERRRARPAARPGRRRSRLGHVHVPRAALRVDMVLGPFGEGWKNAEDMWCAESGDDDSSRVVVLLLRNSEAKEG